MRLLFPDVGPARPPHAPIRLGDRGLWAVLAVAFAMQLLALARLDGYQIADAVEYMDRANMFASGESFDPRTPRPFTFSALMSPLFWLANRLEFDSYLPIVGFVRACQMLVGLVTIWITARIGARIGGRSLGLVAGLCLACSIAFGRYTVTAVADPEAMLFMALGVEQIVAGRSQRRGFLAGLLFGVSILFAYKSAPMSVLLLGGLFLRERLRFTRWWLSLTGGLIVCLTVGATADALVYGKFGSSIDGYIQVNAVSFIGRILVLSGFGDAGRAFYNAYSGAEVIDQVKALGDPRSLSPESWYLENMHLEFLAWPVLALLAIGMLVALVRPRYPYTLFLFATLANYFLLSNKGFKDFRLFLPIMPMIAVLAALGWRAVRGEGERVLGGRPVRAAVAGGLLVVGVVLCPLRLSALNLRKHSGYWRAIELVNVEAERERAELRAGGAEAPPRRVGSAYHWAVSLRQNRDVELQRLPIEMVTYVRRSEREKYDEARDLLLAQFDELDWFIGHIQVLWQSREIMEVVNRNFEIHALLYDAEVYDGLAPICVLRRRRAPLGTLAAHGTRTFFEVYDEVDAAALEDYRRRIEHPVALFFRRELEGGAAQEVELLGWDVERGLGGGDLAWVTYHWYARTDGAEDFAIVDRFTDRDGSAGLLGLEYHRPAYAVHDTSTWSAGSVLRESYPRMLPLLPRGFGGGERRGELVPTELWISIQRSLPGQPDYVQMQPWNAHEGRPYTPGPAPADAERGTWAHDGRFWDSAGRVLVGGCWLPVPRAMRVPDDGQPLP